MNNFITTEIAQKQIETNKLHAVWFETFARHFYQCNEEQLIDATTEMRLSMQAAFHTATDMVVHQGCYFGESSNMLKPEIRTNLNLLRDSLKEIETCISKGEVTRALRGARAVVLYTTPNIVNALKERTEELEDMIDTAALLSSEVSVSSTQVYHYYRDAFLEKLATARFIMVDGVWLPIERFEVQSLQGQRICILVTKDGVTQPVYANSISVGYYAMQLK